MLLGFLFIIVPATLVGLVVFKHSHPPMFTSLPPIPVVTPYTPPPRIPVLEAMKVTETELKRPEIAASAAKITNLESALARLETEVYSNNPALCTYKNYITVVDRWYEERPSHRQALSCYQITQDPEETRRHQEVCSDLLSLFTMVLVKEHGQTPAFEPLFQSMAEQMLKWQTQLDFFDADRLAEYPQNRNMRISSFEQWMAEVNSRYPFYVAAIEKIIHNKGVPPEVVTDIKNYAAQTFLSSLAVEWYVPNHTPPELVKLRKDLDNQIRDLSLLRATSGNKE
jgi:hypothetical protein